MKMKQCVVLLFLMLFVVNIAGCSTNTPGSKTDPKSIVLGIENESEKLNPLFNDEHDDAVFLVFSGLVRFNEKNEPVPDLAKQWDVSPDKLTYTFYLRNDVKWHDGKPFTADDVKFTIEQILNPKNNAKIRFKFEEIKSVEVVDPYQVKVALKSPFPPLLDSMAVGMIPKHLLEGKDINNDTFNQTPVGTGPYKLGEWKKGQYMALIANKDFYRGAPKSDKVVLKFLPNQSVRAVQLETGEIDAALVDPGQMERVGKVADLKTYRMKTADYRVLMYNMKSPLWQDVRVRQALNYAVNRDALVKGVLLGWGKPAYGPLQYNWANNPDVTKYEYNPEKAKQLLTEAGWTLGADGVWQKNGKRLSFKMTTFAHDPVRVAFINALSTEFKKVGVEAIPDPREKGSFKIGDMETFLLGWGSPFDPDEHTYRLFHSSQIKDGWNLQSYKNEQVDDLLFKARTTDDKDERGKLYAEFQKVLSNDPPFNFLVYLDAAVVANKRVTGIQERVLGHHGAGYVWNIEEWSKQ